MNVADQARAAGRKIHVAAPGDVAAAINAGMAEVIGWPFAVTSGRLFDLAGKQTAAFASVVHTAKQGFAPGDDIPADNAMAVIDVVEELDINELRASHARLLVAKHLEKSAAPQTRETPVATVTLTIIFARKARTSIETITDELNRLNEPLPHSEWIDMVAVSDTAVVSYGCQLAGQFSLGGILPPSRGVKYSPAWYVIPTMLASRDGTFNKVVAFIVSYIVFFSPGTAYLNFNDLLEGTSKNLVTSFGYQYNLSGDLVPVPRNQYVERLLPPRPIIIESRGKKELLASLVYVPWQDGGVVLSRGKLPLEGLLIFLGKEALKNGGVIRTGPDTQVSHVLPITPVMFAEMVDRLRNQSNMIVRQVEPKYTMEKLADEGTTTPFIARLFVGLLYIRESAYPDQTERLAFDGLLNQVLTPLLSARVSAQEIEKTWSGHLAKIEAGQAVRMEGGSLRSDGDDHRALRKEVNNFLHEAAKAMKEGGQKIGKSTGKNIGFLFQGAGTYATGLRALQASDPSLASYVQQTRDMWSERLINARNDLEHGGWTLPRIAYKQRNGKIIAQQPAIDGTPVLEFVRTMLDRVSCFTEDFIVHCLQAKLPSDISLAEIPLPERAIEAPERFRITLAHGGLPLWTIVYAARRFEET
jgi:hypothetical protein